MRKLVLVCAILASVVSVSMGAMSYDEWQRAEHNCRENQDKNSCQALINHGLVSVEQCYIEKGEGNCVFVGAVYFAAERYREAIPYFEKAIALGDNVRGYGMLGAIYYKLQDYYNAKKYFEIACDKGDGISCCSLGLMYYEGEVVRQDYYRAHELYKKACDMKYGRACNNLGVLYAKGLGVRQNRSTAEQYFKKACDLGDQRACSAIEAKQFEDMLRFLPESKKAMLEMEKLELESKKLELERLELEQKLQKYK